MKKILLILGLLLSVSLLANEAEFYKPSFDCKNVEKNTIEYKICTDEELASLDKQLNDIWKSFYVITRELKKEQRRWLKERNNCKTTECLKQTYQERITTLQQRLKNQRTFPKRVLDALKNSLDMEEGSIYSSVIQFHKSSGIKESTSQKFRNAFLTFGMRFKEPIVKNVSYDDQKLKEYLGECYDFRFDINTYNGTLRHSIEHAVIVLSKPAARVFSLIPVRVNDKPYYILQSRERDSLRSGTDYLISPQECKQIKEHTLPQDIKKGRFEHNFFEPENCEGLNLSEYECNLVKHRFFYIPKTNPVDVVSYKGGEIIFLR